MKIENTSDAAVYLPKTLEESYTFPRAIKKQVADPKSGDSRIVTSYTAVECDDEVIKNLREKNKVVAGYFARKVLRVVGSGPPTDASTPGGKAK